MIQGPSARQAILEPAAEHFGLVGRGRAVAVTLSAAMPSELFDEVDQLADMPPTIAVVIVTVIPALMVYPFVQKHFTKGQLTGAIKG